MIIKNYLFNKTLLLIIIAFIFSFSVRLIWIDYANSQPSFKLNDKIMINTNDGYYYAEGARDILSGSHQDNDHSPIFEPLSKLTALIAMILPFDFDTVILYMSSFFGSLLVIPLILIGSALKRLDVGFMAAIIGSITWSYYNRTMTGYYDTDMLNIVFPMFLLWSLIVALLKNNNIQLAISGIISTFYMAWYQQGYSVIFALLVVVVVYSIFVYFKQNNKSRLTHEVSYSLMLGSILLLTLGQFYILFKIALVIFMAYLFFKVDLSKKKIIYYIVAFSVFLFMIGGGIEPIWHQLEGYILRDTLSVANNDLNLHFYSVMQTIREAGSISYERFSNRISGNEVVFVLSIIGYVMLIVRYPIMFLSLPMVGLGFLAYKSGLRFTVYAVPIFAFSISYLIYFSANYIKNNFNIKFADKIIMAILVIAVLIPNIIHIINYKAQSVFVTNEVKILKSLKKIATPEDYVVAWWDYGYPIRYYADVKTLGDGSLHSGRINFPVSFMLTKRQDSSANMARLAVEYQEKKYENIKNNIAQKPILEKIITDYGYKNPNKFLLDLNNKDFELPNKTRDIYLYLPNRMLNIFPVVNVFSSIDIKSGKIFGRAFFYMARKNDFIIDKNSINFKNGIKVFKNEGKIRIGDKKYDLKSFNVTSYNSDTKLRVSTQALNQSAFLHVVYMKNYNQMLIVDDDVYNSVYFKLFVFEQYDKNLFEPVILSPVAKVYKFIK